MEEPGLSVLQAILKIENCTLAHRHADKHTECVHMNLHTWHGSENTLLKSVLSSTIWGHRD